MNTILEMIMLEAMVEAMMEDILAELEFLAMLEALAEAIECMECPMRGVCPVCL